ncbi:MAG: YceI family protein [Cyclobacteriaceae bacterium]|jgi:polyisoprenoid-binding protein YceI|nr:YceI family protein [Flammeovirgaceae bacterium]MCZ8022380.1 YceI family protein [Cytophagales bacterium]MCZ8327464.1 YceI family protein [Cyclobacteriaceae bacterium]
MKKIVIVSLVVVALAGTWLLYNHFRVVEPPINKEQSDVAWSGKSVSGGHYGKVGIKDAKIFFQGGKLTGGYVTMDMQNITVEDITDPQGKIDFIGHIANEDFFEVNLYPEAKFIITDVKPDKENEFLVTGDLTIKNITQPTTVTVKISERNQQQFAEATLNIDRTLFGVEYGVKGKKGSDKDWFIYNDFTIKVNLKIEQ